MTNQPIAFVDVNVVPMTEEKILRNQTVLVRGDRIAQIGSTDATTIPDGALRIDGGGRYLMPGLADMHTHVWEEADFLLFVANGVTTIRNMWGGHRQLAWRKKINEGLLLGPTIFTCGPLIDGSPPIWNNSKVILTPKDAEEEIFREKEIGYDFVKVYNRLPVEAYDAILSSAKRLGIPVVGHVPDRVGLLRALESGQYSIEHLTGYIDAIQAEDSPVKNKFDFESSRKAIDYAEERKIPEVVSATKNSATWNCVTLVVMQKFVSTDDAKILLQDQRMRFVPPNILASWDPSKDFRLKEYTVKDFERLAKANAMRKRFTLELHRAGARILLGTDTPNPFVIPGYSIHEELRNLVEAGLSPYGAIRAGTRDAAEFLSSSEEFGTLEEGKRADMILLESNPLEDVGNISNPLGVMLRGKWYSREQLREMLEALVSTYSISEKDLESHFEHFPNVDESYQPSRYLIKFSGTLTGEERFAVNFRRDSKIILIDSQVCMNSPPRIDRFLMQLKLTQEWSPVSLFYESQASEGSCKVIMRRTGSTIRISGNHPDGSKFEIEKEESEDVLFGSLHFATLVPAVNRLLTMEVGQTRELKMLRLESLTDIDFTKVRLSFQRKSDLEKPFNGRSAKLRVYDFEDISSNASSSGSLFVDCNNRPVLFERAGQMSFDRYELIEDAKVAD
ncbi:MAG TPA: amidohydrolase family protein [Nitrososphaerales archaeon]|nr:amidohydrolase family protein [Nitrososphaerales archaeon]